MSPFGQAYSKPVAIVAAIQPPAPGQEFAVAAVADPTTELLRSSGFNLKKREPYGGKLGRLTIGALHDPFEASRKL